MLNIQPGIHQNLSVLVSLLMQEINECSILLTLFSNIIQVLILWRPLNQLLVLKLSSCSLITR